jgi:hypothetical protein
VPRGVPTAIEWTRDGRRLLVGGTTPQGASLWLVDPLADTVARISADVPEPNFWDLSLSADGRRLLFTAGRPAARQNMVIVKGIR